MAKISVKHDPKAAVSHRGGFLLRHEYLDHIGIDKRVNEEFGAPGPQRLIISPLRGFGRLGSLEFQSCHPFGIGIWRREVDDIDGIKPAGLT